MNWLMGAIGLSFAAAPFLFGFNQSLLAVGFSALLGGFVVVVAGLRATLRPATWWDYWVATLLGLTVVAAPFALGLNLQHKALVVSLVLGVIVILLAGYQGLFARPRTK